MKSQDPDLPLTYLAYMDFAFGQTYSIAQFFTGSFGDIFNKRYLLTISLSIQAVLFFLVGYIGRSFATNLEGAFWYMFTCFMFLGLI